MAAARTDGEWSQIADAHQWSVIRLRLATLVLTMSIALVAIRLDAHLHALWVLLVLPLFWSADVRLSGLADNYRDHALLQRADGTWDIARSTASGPEIAPASQIAWSSHRAEFYTLMTFAPMIVILQG